MTFENLRQSFGMSNALETSFKFRWKKLEKLRGKAELVSLRFTLGGIGEDISDGRVDVGVSGGGI